MNTIKTFLFSYNFEGAEYSLEIPASTVHEAKQRLTRMAFARYDGELFEKIPATSVTGLYVRLKTWLLNNI